MLRYRPDLPSTVDEMSAMIAQHCKKDMERMMARIPYPELETLSASTRQMVEQMPLKVTHMLAGASPGVLEGMIAFSTAFYNGKTRLPADLREVAILRAGYIAGSAYETWQHEALSRDIGLSEEVIAAIKAGGKQPALTPAQQAVLDFADDFIVNVRASDATLDEVRRHLADDQLIDLMFVTGLYMTVSRFLETTGVEIDGVTVNSKMVAGNS